MNAKQMIEALAEVYAHQHGLEIIKIEVKEEIDAKQQDQG